MIQLTAGLCLVLIGLICAAIGGMGGGGILVPVYMIFWLVPTKFAIPLSNVTILGSACSHFLMNKNRAHPHDRHSPIIDYNLALMMEPTTILGSIVGAVLNKALSPTVLSIALLVLLTSTCVRMAQKYQLVSRQEQERGLLNAGTNLRVIHNL